MAEMLLVDSLKELRTLIDQQHLLYLELDEIPIKIDQRNKLESIIREYLCLAPHDTKFTFHQTADVLHQSASTKNNFSAYKAAVAWKAIGKYADNLISHPWRKEYREIKLYCGFYKHEIEESLVGAEFMFEAMGYRHTGHSSMTLLGILDPDRITSVSKDAILAYVECQIMKQIWETLSSYFNISWLEILEFRENHIGTPEQVIRALTYKYRQRQYQEQAYHRSENSLNTSSRFPQPECYYGQHSMGYYNQPQYSGHPYSLSAQTRYANMVHPQQMIPSPLYPTSVHPSYVSSHHVIKPQDVYPVNGYHMHSHYSAQTGLHHVPHNGFSLVPMMYSAPSIVPTGQLIEFDTSPTHNGGETYYHKVPNSSRYNLAPDEFMQHQNYLKNDVPSLSSKAKNDGAGSWENWDYVYRNLESQGYKKEPGSLGDILSKDNQPSSSQNNSSDVDIDSIIHTDISEKMHKMDLSSNSKGHSEISSNNEPRVKSVKDKCKVDSERVKELGKVKVENKSASPENSGKEAAVKSSSSQSASGKANVNLKQEKSQAKDSNKAIQSREGTKALIVNLDDEDEKWQCITCTYLNSLSNNVCEMCYKSRERGSELNPQPSGGAECPKCTLVNEPGLASCAACNTCLKDSPTYI